MLGAKIIRINNTSKSVSYVVSFGPSSSYLQTAISLPTSSYLQTAICLLPVICRLQSVYFQLSADCNLSTSNYLQTAISLPTSSYLQTAICLLPVICILQSLYFQYLQTVICVLSAFRMKTVKKVTIIQFSMINYQKFNKVKIYLTTFSEIFTNHKHSLGSCGSHDKK